MVRHDAATTTKDERLDCGCILLVGNLQLLELCHYTAVYCTAVKTSKRQNPRFLDVQKLYRYVNKQQCVITSVAYAEPVVEVSADEIPFRRLDTGKISASSVF